MSLFKLNNVIQNYGWGSQDAMTRLFGIANPGNKPQAEIWMGAHPGGCSRISESGLLLSDVIARDPVGVLGHYTCERFGGLPYLFKVLAADKPLSVQVHPGRDKAKQGYSRENRTGISLNSENRNYKDDNHKPELVYALTFYKAMNGFRPIEDIVSLFEEARITTLQKEIMALKDMPGKKSLQTFFTRVMNLEGEEKGQAISELHQASNSQAQTLKAREAFALVREFEVEYAGDIGLFSPLLLNIVELEPGEAMFLHAETLHAYVKGTGLELMANSDNVLRAGLTPKHMDVAELIDNTRFEPTNPDTIKLEAINKENKVGFPIPVDDFDFEVITVDGQLERQFVRGPEILFCIEGKVDIQTDSTTLSLQAGESAFVCDSARSYQYQGVGRVARAFN